MPESMVGRGETDPTRAFSGASDERTGSNGTDGLARGMDHAIGFFALFHHKGKPDRESHDPPQIPEHPAGNQRLKADR